MTEMQFLTILKTMAERIEVLEYQLKVAHEEARRAEQLERVIIEMKKVREE